MVSFLTTLRHTLLIGGVSALILAAILGSWWFAAIGGFWWLFALWVGHWIHFFEQGDRP